MKPKNIRKIEYYKVTTESRLINNFSPWVLWCLWYLPAFHIFRVLRFFLLNKLAFLTQFFIPVFLKEDSSKPYKLQVPWSLDLPWLLGPGGCPARQQGQKMNVYAMGTQDSRDTAAQRPVLARWPVSTWRSGPEQSCRNGPEGPHGLSPPGFCPSHWGRVRHCLTSGLGCIWVAGVRLGGRGKGWLF